VRKTFLASLAVCAALLSLPLWLAHPVCGQAPSVERVFQNPKLEVDQAIEELHVSLSGRLPILEGFAETTDDSLDHYERGYYHCVLRVSSDASGGSVVRATAKITAWYTDGNPAQSGYRVLPSNGRLETDLLDRLEEILGKKTAAPAPAPRSARVAEVPTSAPSLPPNTTNAPVANKPAFFRSTPPVLSPPGAAVPVRTVDSTVPRANNEDLSSLQQRREEAEKHMEALNGDVQNLEEILHSQAHPTDLVVVRKSGTPVFAKPRANALVLFPADAEDEFQLLDRQGAWVHVEVSGVSRGWIRRAQVDLPEGFSDPPPPEGDAPFRVARQETHAFPGDWQPLRGKSVRIIWVEPASQAGQTSSAQAKRDFAKSLFPKVFKEVSSADQTVAGVVIVFDSADGGQISATLSSLADWQAGTLSEASFWQQCSLDPPESFEPASKP
jgi:hypothetical protein